MVQKSAVKKYFRDKGFRSKPEIFDALQRTICKALDKAIESATNNKRKTVQVEDIVV